MVRETVKKKGGRIPNYYPFYFFTSLIGGFKGAKEELGGIKGDIDGFEGFNGDKGGYRGF